MSQELEATPHIHSAIRRFYAVQFCRSKLPITPTYLRRLLKVIKEEGFKEAKIVSEANGRIEISIQKNGVADEGDSSDASSSNEWDVVFKP